MTTTSAIMRRNLQYRWMREAIVVVSAMALAPTLSFAQQAAATGYEEYAKRELENAKLLLPAAERSFQQEIIATRVARFQQTGNAAMIFALAMEKLPPDLVIPTFANLTTNANAEARGFALLGLTNCDPPAIAAVDRIIQCYSDPDDEVAWRAAEAISAIGPGAVAAVGPLKARLARTEDYMRQRRAAINALARIGPAAVDSIPLIEKFVRDLDTNTAYDAFKAIGAIRNEPSIDPASIAGDNGQLFLGRDAYRAFAAINSGAVPRDGALAALRTVLLGGAPSAQKAMALEAIGSLKPSDPETIAVVLKYSVIDDGFLSRIAEDSLHDFAPTDEKTMLVLASALSLKNERLALLSAKALLRFGPRVTAQLGVILKNLRESTGTTDYSLIGAYLDLLRAIGKKSGGATELLTGWLADDSMIYHDRPQFASKALRRYLVVTLADIGITPAALPAIADLLANSNDEDSVAAGARGAAALGRGAAPLAATLQKILETQGLDAASDLNRIESGPIRWDANVTSAYLETIRALEKIGPAAKPAISILRKRAEDPVVESPLPKYQQEAARVADVLSRG
jgi:HEAT repeat protein